MFYLIFIILIIWWVCKSTTNFIRYIPVSILQKKGFNNITPIKHPKFMYLFQADFHGDNYLIFYGINLITAETVDSLYVFASKQHYHNIIIIVDNSCISINAKPKIEKYNIKIWNPNEIANNFSPETNASSIINKMPLDDNCKIDESYEPIQDGSKVNSIFGNLFNNKIEKL